MNAVIIATVVFVLLAIAVFIRMAQRQQRLEKEVASCLSQTESLQSELTATFENQISEMRTEIKSLEEGKKRLRGYLDILDKLIHSIPNPIYFKDQDGVFRGCNRAFAKDFLGLSNEKIIGRTHQDMAHVISPKLADMYHRKDMRLLEGKGQSQFETRAMTANGEERDFLVSRAVYTQEDSGTASIVGVMLDLTEKNRVAEEKLNNEKLQGVLEMAGAVCHELNQPMMAISGFAELLLLDCPETDPQHQNLTRIQDQVDRMAVITRKLLGITKYKTKEYAGGSKIIDIDESAT